jgi:hypothetical protein
MVGLLGAALSACGGTASTVEMTVPARTSSIPAAPVPPQSAPTTTRSVPTTARSVPTTASPANGEASEEPKTVPNVTGVRLGVAAKDLRRRGLLFKVVGDGATGVVEKSNWTVCGTNPLPHSYIEVGTTIYLTVAPSCG